MPIKSLAVFCGSKNGVNPLYLEQAAALGKLMATLQITLVYGGGNVGLMGALADSTMENGGKVIGIIPKVLVDWERQHENITELIIADDMHTRKKTIYSLCDAALILPGGFGTLDEMFEILTWNQLAIHEKQVFILNAGGFYDHLIGHIMKMKEEEFLYERAVKSISVVNDVSELEKEFRV